jgi:dihydrofolate synthase/folylpolyglutamate synthase
MELAWDKPKILVDGAHNPSSLQSLIRCIGAHIPYDSMVCVFGCCADKDVGGMLRELSLGADKIIFTKSNGNPRAAEPRALQRQFAEISGKMTQVAETLGEALEIAARATSRDDLICVTGSFYLVGDAKKHLTELAKKQ